MNDRDLEAEFEEPARRKRIKKPHLAHPLILVVADILLAGFILLLFTYFHHGKAYFEGTGKETEQKQEWKDVKKDVTFTLDAPASNIGSTITATVEVSSTESLSHLVLELEYDATKLEAVKPYETGNIFRPTAIYEFTEEENEDGKNVITLTAESTEDGIIKTGLGTVYTLGFVVKEQLNNVTPIKIDIPDGGIIKLDKTGAPTYEIKDSAATQSQRTLLGDFSDNFPEDTFLKEGEPTVDEYNEDTKVRTYKTHNANITITRYQVGDVNVKYNYYVADIYVRNIDMIKTAVSQDFSASVNRLAEKNNAILAINGDFFRARTADTVRNGEILRKGKFKDVLVLYKDGTMKAFSASQFDLDAEMSKEALQVWSFGPSLLDSEGHSKTEFDSTVNPANPRSVIGYYEPGHYCFVAVNGRGAENSQGIRMEELSELIESLHCKVAYNLDGGNSSVMVWDNGSVNVNTPSGGGRDVSDIIYIVKE